MWWCAPSASIACGFYSSIYDIRPSAHTKCEIKLNQISQTHFSNSLNARFVRHAHCANAHITLRTPKNVQFRIDVANWPGVFYCLFQIAMCFFSTAPSAGATINFHLAKVQRWRKKSTTNQLKYHSNSCINFVLLNNSILSRCRGQANRNKFIRKWSVNRLYLFDGAFNCGMWILVCCLRLRWWRRTTIWQHQTAITVTTFFSTRMHEKNAKHSTWCLATQNKILLAFFLDSCSSWITIEINDVRLIGAVGTLVLWCADVFNSSD